MTGVNGGDREERAKEALIVSALRRDDHPDEQVDVDRLPKLTEEEERALESFAADFIERLMAGEMDLALRHRTNEQRERPDSEPAAAAGAAGFGLDRAEEIDEETKAELEEQRKKIVERKEGEKEADGEADRA